MAAPDRRLDEAMAVEDGMDGASGGDPDIAGQAAHQELPDLAGAPMRLVALQADDRGFQLRRQLVGIAHRPTRPVGQGLQPVLLVTIEDLVAGLARDAELTAHMAHLLAFQQARHETQAFVHNRTLFPRHPHLPQAIAWARCYPCVRYKTSPMSRVGQNVAVPTILYAAAPRRLDSSQVW